jgi:peptidoglycan/xylan/chitin deacetylase (PgdA/CDA1 family)
VWSSPRLCGHRHDRVGSCDRHDAPGTAGPHAGRDHRRRAVREPAGDGVSAPRRRGDDAIAGHAAASSGASRRAGQRATARTGAGENGARTALLTRWVAAGHTLGNHTYSHPDANALSADAYQQDIARGDHVTRELMAGRGPYTQYFRHPFTHTGDTADKKASIDASGARSASPMNPNRRRGSPTPRADRRAHQSARHVDASSAARPSSSGAWAERIRRRASGSGNHAARSASGNCC